MTLFVFFFNDTATTEIYTLSLHDALPISGRGRALRPAAVREGGRARACGAAVPGGSRRSGDGLVRVGARARGEDRKSTRLNSSHANISYAVFCLKKKKNSHYISHA